MRGVFAGNHALTWAAHGQQQGNAFTGLIRGGNVLREGSGVEDEKSQRPFF